MFRPLLPLVFFIVFAGSCGFGSSPEEAAPDTAVAIGPPPPPPPPPPAGYSYQVIENIDSLGAKHGFGYDIYQDNKRVIHQVNIPGEPGIDGFVSAEEAERVAVLVMEKMKAGGGFPTVSHIELIDLGITLKTQ